MFQRLKSHLNRPVHLTYGAIYLFFAPLFLAVGIYRYFPAWIANTLFCAYIISIPIIAGVAGWRREKRYQRELDSQQQAQQAAEREKNYVEMQKAGIPRETVEAWERGEIPAAK